VAAWLPARVRFEERSIVEDRPWTIEEERGFERCAGK